MSSQLHIIIACFGKRAQALGSQHLPGRFNGPAFSGALSKWSLQVYAPAAATTAAVTDVVVDGDSLQNLLYLLREYGFNSGYRIKLLLLPKKATAGSWCVLSLKFTETRGLGDGGIKLVF